MSSQGCTIRRADCRDYSFVTRKEFYLLLVLFMVVYPFAVRGDSKRQLDGGSQKVQSIIDLQPFRQVASMKVRDSKGREGLAKLINLNPNINAWYVLQLDWRDSPSVESYHLENVNPLETLLLAESHPDGLLITNGKERFPCGLWGGDSQGRLKEAKRSGTSYASLCQRRLYLRNPTKGRQTQVEAVTDFLRNKVPGGEGIVTIVRDTFFRYIYQRKAEEPMESKSALGLSPKMAENGPAPAVLDLKQGSVVVKPADLGIEMEERGGMLLGSWYLAKDNPGIFVSVIVPKAITPEIMNSYNNLVNRLDRVELEELVYLVAFDLDRFDLKYALGTEHPRVDWSDHILSQMKERSLPGPDGIGTITPLVSTGIINPVDAGRTVATFTGGFKRTHGAFQYGPLAFQNHGSHYGFLENGVLFSTLQPGLSTIYVLHDGWADMKTWAEEDRHLLSGVRYARQNGMPIIAGFDEATRMSVPGNFVARWGEGNWSGSAGKKLRTMRAGAALQGFKGKRFLIYAFFWSATPSAMARVFQSYQCRYAMLLDMNALVHTYLAVYRRQGTNLYVQHLIQGMKEVDLSVKGEYFPRFLAYSDDRDFFYLTRKELP